MGQRWRWCVIQQNQTGVPLSPLRPVQTSGGPQRRHQQERSGPSRSFLRPRWLRSVHEADRKQTLLPRRRWHHGHIWGEVMWPWQWTNDDDEGVNVCVFAGGDGAVHGSRGSGWSSEPPGLRVGAEAGGYVRPGFDLLGDLHEMHRPFPRWARQADRQTAWSALRL